MQATRPLLLVFLFLALSLSATAPAKAAHGQMAEEPVLSLVTSPELGPEPELLAPVVFHSPRLEALVGELERASPTARAMLLAIRRAGFPISFGTFADLADDVRREYRSWDPEHRGMAGFMAPVVRWAPGLSGALTTVRIMVAVNLVRLDEIFAEADSLPGEPPVPWKEIERLETLSVLAHEIVHAYGLAVSGGDPRNGCHDPRAGERVQDSCVMIGENTIRRELGAPIDWDYGLPSIGVLEERYVVEAVRLARLAEIAAFRLPPTPRQLPERTLAGGWSDLPVPSASSH